MTDINYIEFEKTYRIREDMRGSFHDRLFEIIDEKGFTNKEVYTRSNMDRKRFSKIQCTADVKPSKGYILALCIGLKVSVDVAEDLLARADKAFNPNDERDQFIKGFLKDGGCDILQVNSFLSERGYEILGCID